MFEKIINYSVKNKLIVFLGVLALIIGGWTSLRQIAIDAVPDITNNQVQVVTVASTLAAEEVEQYVTYPIEAVMANIPGVTELRSISRYGLSVITIVFEDKMDIMKARQFVGEQIQLAASDIPPELGVPEMMPITTGLGEIYQYVLTVDDAYKDHYSDMDLRTFQDWIVKRQLTGIEGIIEVSSFGGKVRQYEVAADPVRMLERDVTIEDIHAALLANNSNSGGSYVEQRNQAFYIRTEGRVEHLQDIAMIPVLSENGVPVRIRDIATVGYGSPQRYGAMTMDGKGEVVGGITLMLKGANSSQAIANVQERIEQVEAALPEGVHIYPYLDRSELVDRTIHTVSKNLIEGGLIVIFIVVLLLGNFRAGLVVASVIPLSMLFAIILMRIFGVSANLMSLGAIDFGIVVDGAVIIVESVLHYLYTHKRGRKLSATEMDTAISFSAAQIYQSAAFGVLIILVVFVPIFTLQGIEGKMFLPMAQTVSFAVLGSLILSLTYVPAATALFLSREIGEHHTFADRLVGWLRRRYLPAITMAVKRPLMVTGGAIMALILAIILFTRMGAEFVPTLEEGDLAMQMAVAPGSSLTHSIATSTKAEALLLEHFPEVEHVVSKIGTAEVPTDPMAIEDADIMIILKDKDEWVSADNREDLIAQMKKVLEPLQDASFEFTQPIQLRFNELMTGAKTDIAVQIYGEDVKVLKQLGDSAAAIIKTIEGAGDVKVEQTEGLKQWRIIMDRQQMAALDINVEQVNMAIRAAYAGETAGTVYENERRFDLVVRMDDPSRSELNLGRIFVRKGDGTAIPISQVAHMEQVESPMQISREDARRLIKVGVNVRDIDVATLVAAIESDLQDQLQLPPGYFITYGGAFENLQHAVERLTIAVPVALLLILFLLYITFRSVSKALIIFVAVPLSAVGGVLALTLRGLPFSISAGIGFIALFGVAVLNGIVLMNEYIRLSNMENVSLRDRVIQGAVSRLRPVLMTALVASLGFLPMAISTGSGAEVQRPLATVVIGGLITATLLTLVVLPAIYYLFEKRKMVSVSGKSLLLLLMCIPFISQAQQPSSEEDMIAQALSARPELQVAAWQESWWQAEADAAWVLPPAAVDAQYGQINFAGNDYQIGFQQELGKPWASGAKKEWAFLGAAAASKSRDQLSAEISWRVRLAYQGFLIQEKKASYLQMIEEDLKDAAAQVDAWKASGMITESDKMQMQQLLRNLREMQFGASTESYRYVEELRYLCGNQVLEPKKADPQQLKPVMFFTEPTVNAVHTQAMELEVAQIRAYEKVIDNQKVPDLALGYFLQSLNGEQGFQGVRAVVSLPIAGSGRKQALLQNELKTLQQEAMLTDRERQLHNELEVAQQRAMMAANVLAAYDTAPEEQFRNVQDELLAQFHAGEMDVFTFVQHYNSVLHGVSGWLDALYQYNQSLITIQYLTLSN
jgi:heavy metal efflux system protein